MTMLSNAKRIERVGTIIKDRDYSIAEAAKTVSCGESTIREAFREKNITPGQGKILKVKGQAVLDLIEESNAVHDEIDRKKETEKAERKQPKQTEMRLSDTKTDRRITIEKNLLDQCIAIAVKSDDGNTAALINRYVAAQLKKVNA